MADNSPMDEFIDAFENVEELEKYRNRLYHEKQGFSLNETDIKDNSRAFASTFTTTVYTESSVLDPRSTNNASNSPKNGKVSTNSRISTLQALPPSKKYPEEHKFETTKPSTTELRAAVAQKSFKPQTGSNSSASENSNGYDSAPDLNAHSHSNLASFHSDVIPAQFKVQTPNQHVSRSNNNIYTEPDMYEAPKASRVQIQKKSSWIPPIFGKKSEPMLFPKETLKLNDKFISDFKCVKTLQTITNQTKKTSKGSNPCWVAKFSPDERYLAIGGADHILKVFEINECDAYSKEEIAKGNLSLLKQEPRTFIKHSSDIIDLDWSSDSKRIVTGSLDNIAILWDLRQQEPLQIFPHCDIVSCVCFHPLISDALVTGCFDKIIRIWSTSDNKVIDWFQAQDMITALCFSPDFKFLLVGFYKGIVKIYRADQGKLRFEMEIECKNKFSFGKTNKHGKKVTGIVFVDENEFIVSTNDSRLSIEKEMLISGSDDGLVYIWNKTTDFVPEINPRFTNRKKNRNTSYETLRPFAKDRTTIAMFVPFGIMKKIQQRMLSVWNDQYLDSLMLFISYDSDIKITGNFIELNC